MARSKPSGGTQLKDLSRWGEVAFVLACAGGIAAGWMLPRWITVIGIAVVFLAAFVVQKVGGKI